MCASAGLPTEHEVGIDDAAKEDGLALAKYCENAEISQVKGHRGLPAILRVPVHVGRVSTVELEADCEELVLMMILHTFRVYLTGGFKKPRELTWITGVILAVITVTFGVTGYSLPWDQVGYWAVKIVSGVPDAIPVVGGTLVELLRGGQSVGQATLTRFYSLHTFVLPWLIAVFMLAHFLMIRKQGISGPL